MAAKKAAPKVYYVYDSNCDNMFGEFDDLEEAKENGIETLQNNCSSNYDEGILVLQLVGILKRPVTGVFTPV